MFCIFMSNLPSLPLLLMAKTKYLNTKSREPTGHETNPSSTNETSKQSVIRDSVDCTRTIREVLNPNIQVSNRFSNLNIDKSNQNDVNTTQNDTIIDHREPATISKEVNGKSNRP